MNAHLKSLLVAVAFLSATAPGLGQLSSGTVDDVRGDCTCKCCKEDACDAGQYTYVNFMSGGYGNCTADACRALSAACPDEGSHNGRSVVAASSIDCACSCCTDSHCPRLTTNLFAAGGRERCTPEWCSASFARCPDTGSHHQSSEVYSEFFDCTCQCCADPAGCAEEDFNYMRYWAGTSAGCSAEQCSARFQQCPDAGSHNDGTAVVAAYSGADYDTAHHSCDCACCKGSACLSGRSHYTFFAQAASQCTAEACSANFAQCPDAGSHSYADEVFATYYDCKCSCCREGECPAYTTNVFMAGSSGACTPEQCSARFAQCPDAGSHNDGADVQVIFNSLVEASVVLEEGPGSLSTAGVIGIIAALGIVVLALVAIAITYFTKKAKGYRWISEEELNKLQDVAACSALISRKGIAPQTETKIDGESGLQMAEAETNRAYEGQPEEP